MKKLWVLKVSWDLLALTPKMASLGWSSMPVTGSYRPIIEGCWNLYFKSSSSLNKDCFLTKNGTLPFHECSLLTVGSHPHVGSPFASTFAVRVRSRDWNVVTHTYYISNETSSVHLVDAWRTDGIGPKLVEKSLLKV